MGIDISTIQYFELLKAKLGVDYSKTAMLGRQKILGNGDWSFANESYERFKQEDGYSENLFMKLGGGASRFF